ncbi:hypothetical protein L873DRAFT_1714683, partial [Choiromyces venosus 120613-1]
LSWAAREGSEEVVELLLTWEDITLYISDRWGRTPLVWTAKGHQDMGKLLLAQEDVNPNRTDTELDLTRLLWASRGGTTVYEYDNVPILSSRSRSKDESEPASPESESLLQGVACVELAALGRQDPRLPLRWSANFEGWPDVGGGDGVNIHCVETLSRVVRREWRASDHSVLERVVPGAMGMDILGREGMVCSLLS